MIDKTSKHNVAWSSWLWKNIFLKPVSTLFPNVLMNPASSTLEHLAGWALKKSILIFLNDFRWTQRGIQGEKVNRKVFLNLLEGQNVSLPAPKNTNSSRIKVTKLMPIFAISIEEIRYWEKTVSEAQIHVILEVLMMEQWWNSFQFSCRIPKEEKRDIPDCKACFPKLVLQKKTKNYTLLSQIRESFGKHLCTVLLFIYGPVGHFKQNLILFLWRGVAAKYFWAAFLNTFFDHIIPVEKQQILD